VATRAGFDRRAEHVGAAIERTGIAIVALDRKRAGAAVAAGRRIVGDNRALRGAVEPDGQDGEKR
jgi:hypothetical protein